MSSGPDRLPDQILRMTEVGCSTVLSFKVLRSDNVLTLSESVGSIGFFRFLSKSVGVSRSWSDSFRSADNSVLI